MFVDYMEQLLGEARTNTAKTEYSFDCPFCTDTKKRFRMHSHKLLGWCFNCEWKGNAVKFVSDFQRLSWGDALDIVNFYQEFRPLPQDIFEEVFDKLILDSLDVADNKTYISPPKDFKLLSGTTSMQAGRFIKYAKSRGVTDKQIALHGLGFCPVGEVNLSETKTTRLDNHLFVQTYSDELEPIYWMARAVRPDTMPKAFNPVGGANTINKSDVVFNLNNAKKTGVAVINEGVFDATTVGMSGTALFGKSMSAKQLIQIIKADLDAVYIMLDPDAVSSAINMASLLSKHVKNTYLCDLKGGDPNQVGKAGCLDAIRHAERYSKLLELKMKLT